MDRKKLKAAIVLRGKTVEYMCDEIGISRSAWCRKASGVSDFTRAEMAKISLALGLDEAEFLGIFFDELCGVSATNGGDS